MTSLMNVECKFMWDWKYEEVCKPWFCIELSDSYDVYSDASKNGFGCMLRGELFYAWIGFSCDCVALKVWRCHLFEEKPSSWWIVEVWSKLQPKRIEYV